MKDTSNHYIYIYIYIYKKRESVCVYVCVWRFMKGARNLPVNAFVYE